jgi:hypothetical protein
MYINKLEIAIKCTNVDCSRNEENIVDPNVFVEEINGVSYFRDPKLVCLECGCIVATESRRKKA